MNEEHDASGIKRDAGPVVDRRPTDDKDRVLVEHMASDEMLREIVTQLRTVEDVLDALSESPMFGALVNGDNPMMAMLRK